jgi:hypothetical protein
MFLGTFNCIYEEGLLSSVPKYIVSYKRLSISQIYIYRKGEVCKVSVLINSANRIFVATPQKRMKVFQIMSNGETVMLREEHRQWTS